VKAGGLEQFQEKCIAVFRPELLEWTVPDGIAVCQKEVVTDLKQGRPSMDELIRIGVDTSKSVFQLHGVDGQEKPVLRRKLRRSQFLPFFAKLAPATVGLEACGASHHWGRELQALGHKVILLPPQYVKGYVGRDKSDAADAEAICEAAGRVRLEKHHVRVKDSHQQSLQMLVKVREQFIARRTQLVNSLRGYGAEFGLSMPRGNVGVAQLVAAIRSDRMLPQIAREAFAMLSEELEHVSGKVDELNARLMALHRSNEMSQRLSSIPGVGPVGSMLLTIKAGDAAGFRSARAFAAWLGVTPLNRSTGGKTRLGKISRAGDEMLRSVLVVGATAVLRHMRKATSKRRWPWLEGLIGRKPAKLAAVALANKMARIAWRMMVSGESYRPVSPFMPEPAMLEA
jgi:transposase